MCSSLTSPLGTCAQFWLPSASLASTVASAARRTCTRGRHLPLERVRDSGWHRPLGRVRNLGWHRPLGEHALVAGIGHRGECVILCGIGCWANMHSWLASAVGASTQFWVASAAGRRTCTRGWSSEADIVYLIKISLISLRNSARVSNDQEGRWALTLAHAQQVPYHIVVREVHFDVGPWSLLLQDQSSFALVSSLDNVARQQKLDVRGADLKVGVDV